MAVGSLYPQPDQVPCCWPRCGAPADDREIPLCRHHHQQAALNWIRANALSDRPMFEGPLTPIEELHRRRDEAMAAQSQVYYVRIGDRVKIGYTINMRQRIGALRIREDDVLATEPGGRALEKQRHLEFAAERVGRREDFNPSRRLLAWIEEVREQHGPPKITTYVKSA